MQDLAPHKVIITCAAPGAIHAPIVSRRLPIMADEIAEAVIGAAEAGAAIAHLPPTPALSSRWR